MGIAKDLSAFQRLAQINLALIDPITCYQRGTVSLRSWFQTSWLLIFITLFSGCGASLEARQPTYKEISIAQNLIDQGTINLRKGKTIEARSAFELSEEIYPSAAAIDGIGCTLLMDGDLQNAEHSFFKALSIDPNYFSAWSNLALLYDISGLDAMAESIYQEILTQDPTNVAIRGNFAAILYDNYGASDILDAERLLDFAVILEKHPIIEHNLSLVKFNKIRSNSP